MISIGSERSLEGRNLVRQTSLSTLERGKKEKDNGKTVQKPKSHQAQTKLIKS